MKLIRCYIENFGGLQQYTADFSDGLTVICEPNGFGKTTLAEFIRAMFYGFPRANKDLNKHPRQKYAPWQGGRFGGYLIFEHKGKRYRIDRSFGDAPKSDKFKLYDEDTHRESRDYTADIGTELFGLDADAFLRSTYMPQIRDSGPLTTDSIRAKLGNLLEDTGDVGSYEKAVQRLKDKRTDYEHYRGSGGTIPAAARQISALQQQIRDCQQQQPLLDRTCGEIESIHQAQAETDAAVTEIRARLSQAMAAHTEASLSREYEGLLSRKTDGEARLAALEANYPKGLPSKERLHEISQTIRRADLLRSSLQETAADRAAAETVSVLTLRFATGIPTDAAMDAQRQICDDHNAARAALSDAALSPEESAQLEALSLQFRDSVPTDAQLAEFRSKRSELTALETRAQTLQLSHEDAMRLHTLEGIFAKGVPTQAQLDGCGKQLDEAEALRRENLRLAATLPPEGDALAPAPKPYHSLFFPALIAGIIAAGMGIFLLTMGGQLLPQWNGYHTLAGWICAAIGAAALLTAVLKQNNHKLLLTLHAQQQAAAGITAAQRSLMEDNERRAAALEREAAAFLQAYPAEPDRSLSRRLHDLDTNRALYLPLRQRARELNAAAEENRQRTQLLSEALQDCLSVYFVELPDFDTALQQLQSRKQRYLELTEKRDALARRAGNLRAAIASAEQAMTAFLLSYGISPDPTAFRRALDELQRDADSYTAAVTMVRQRTEALNRRDAELTALDAAWKSFAAEYALPRPLTAQILSRAEHDSDTIAALRETLSADCEKLDAFVAVHGHKPSGALPADTEDPHVLQAEEQQLQIRQTELRRRLVRLEEERRRLRGEIDCIPDLTDELTRVTQQRADHTQRRQLLDTTIDYLQKAREQLSSNYLGGVQGHFAKYLHRLTGEQAGHIAVNSDLEVQLERAGSNRPLPYFSAGQNDAVHLCMRLALSDALFGDEPCFMILDDPFVNLDDAHTEQALALLRELAEERQIVYLVCNTSRTL